MHPRYTYFEKQQDEVASLRDWVSRCQNGRLYGHFDLCGSITGRLSCNNPNLLNIPRHLKPLFYKPPFLKYDFSQIELRLAGQIYNIPTFIQSYQKKEDLHTKTASFLFDKPAEQITKNERHIAKQFNFALIYGASPRTLQEILLEANITLTYDETAYLRAKWFSLHERVKEHIITIANSLKNGTIPILPFWAGIDTLNI
jgi:DNA polymerase I - 3''-5'' exonuclease and polymerase domains